MYRCIDFEVSSKALLGLEVLVGFPAFQAKSSYIHVAFVKHQDHSIFRVFIVTLVYRLYTHQSPDKFQSKQNKDRENHLQVKRRRCINGSSSVFSDQRFETFPL